MKKFVFTLASLSKYKNELKKQKQQECAGLKARLTELMEYESQKRAQLEEASEKYRQSQSEGASAASLVLYSQYSHDLGMQIDKAVEAVLSVQRLLNKRQEELLSILRELKTLENLYNEQYRQYLKEVAQEEERLISEIVSFNTTLPKSDS